MPSNLIFVTLAEEKVGEKPRNGNSGVPLIPSKDLNLTSETIYYEEGSENVHKPEKLENARNISNTSEDLDSSVETIYYEEENSEKIRELEKKITSMEKYIKELETNIHIQRSKNGFLRDKVNVFTGFKGFYSQYFYKVLGKNLNPRVQLVCYKVPN